MRPSSGLLLATVALENIANDGPGFIAPPLENANLAFYSFLFISTLIQLVCTVTYLFRGRSPHVLPSIAAVTAFLFLMVSYSLGIIITIAAWTFDENFVQIIQGQSFLNIDIPTDLFFEWVDPAVFAAVALVLRDRYCAYTKHGAPTEGRQTPLLPFTFTLWLLIAATLVTSGVSTGIFGAAYTAVFSPSEFIGDDQLAAMIKLSNRFDNAFVGLVIITTLFLVVFAVRVKKSTKQDKIVSVTLYWILPFLGARALSRMVFAIINDRLPSSRNFTDNDAYALDLASTIVYGVLHLIVGCFLVHFFMVPRLWDGLGEQTQQGGYSSDAVQPIAHLFRRWKYRGQPHGHSVPYYPPLPHQGLHGVDSYTRGTNYNLGSHIELGQLPDVVTTLRAVDTAEKTQVTTPSAIPKAAPSASTS